MSYRPKDIYKGRRKYRVPLAIALFTVGFLILGTIGMFYLLQQYIVYDQTGVTLMLPSRQTAEADQTPQATPVPTFEPVTVQIIYENTDFSQIDLGGWETLSSTRTLFVPYNQAVNAAKLAASVTDAEGGDYTGLVLELKSEKGQLAWVSGSAFAASYGTSGTADFSEAVASIHDKGLTAAAQISCCADELIATRNWTVALRSVDGSVYQDEDGKYWLDPYNASVRSYLQDLVSELISMGFDEVILSDLYHPSSETGLQYSQTIQTDPSPVTAICQLGRRLAAAAEGTDTAVSVLLDETSLMESAGQQTGQDISIFWRLFARLYCPCSAEGAASALELAAETMNGGEAAVRFVPMCSCVPDGFSSCCIRDESK